MTKEYQNIFVFVCLAAVSCVALNIPQAVHLNLCADYGDKDGSESNEPQKHDDSECSTCKLINNYNKTLYFDSLQCNFDTAYIIINNYYCHTFVLITDQQTPPALRGPPLHA